MTWQGKTQKRIAVCCLPVMLRTNQRQTQQNKLHKQQKQQKRQQQQQK